MPKICPQCKNTYDRKVTGSKITIPEGGDVCKHDVEFAGESSTGVWYVHEHTGQ